MRTIECVGEFTYVRYRLIAIVKINDIYNDIYFSIGGYYPIMFDAEKKEYFVLDNLYNIHLGLYTSKSVDEVLKRINSLYNCSFDVAYYLKFKIFNTDKNFRKFQIEWELKDTTNKIKTKKTSI